MASRVKRHKCDSFISLCKTLQNTQSDVRYSHFVSDAQSRQSVLDKMAGIETLRGLVQWPPLQIACGTNRVLLAASDELVVAVEPVFQNHITKPFAELHSEQLLREAQRDLDVPISLLPFSWGFVSMSYDQLCSLKGDGAPSRAFRALIQTEDVFEGFCVVRVLASSHCTLWDVIRQPSFCDRMVLSCATDVLAKLSLLQSRVPDFVHGDLHVANVLVPAPSCSIGCDWQWVERAQWKQQQTVRHARTCHTLLIDFDLSSFGAQQPPNDLEDLWLDDVKVVLHRDPLEDVLKFLRSLYSAVKGSGRVRCAHLLEKWLGVVITGRRDYTVPPSHVLALCHINTTMECLAALNSRLAADLFLRASIPACRYKLELPLTDVKHTSPSGEAPGHSEPHTSSACSPPTSPTAAAGGAKH